MNTFDLTLVQLDKLITHHIGNRPNEEGTFLSNETTQIQATTLDYLLKYFLLPFKTEERYHFNHPEGLEQNEVYQLVKEIFADENNFVAHSQKLAELLYESSVHPKIKAGELNVAYFSEINLNEEIAEAIGIFKSESNVPFLKMETNEAKFSIDHAYGFEIKNIDKGCIIFNTNEGEGYEILAIDNTSRAADAQYWKDEFLKLSNISNNYHQTREFLNITKQFLTDKVGEDFSINKSEQIDLLNRSVDYFKANEKFDKEEFEEVVFENEAMRASFRAYDEDYQEDKALTLPDNFSISEQAVKKKSRDFKSVIKLDKNFQIYIKGDPNMMEQGVDADGRKYYKFYYEEEK